MFSTGNDAACSSAVPQQARCLLLRQIVCRQDVEVLNSSIHAQRAPRDVTSRDSL